MTAYGAMAATPPQAPQRVSAQLAPSAPPPHDSGRAAPAPASVAPRASLDTWTPRATLSQALAHTAMVSGAIVAGFCHASALRRLHGDPFHYTAWRTAGIIVAIGVPAADAALRYAGGAAVLSAALSLSPTAALLTGANVLLGAGLQYALDAHPNRYASATALAWLRPLIAVAFVASVVAHLDYLLGSVSSDGRRPLSQPIVQAGLGGALLGAAAGWAGRAAQSEVLRVGGFAGVALGVVVAIYGATRAS